MNFYKNKIVQSEYVGLMLGLWVRCYLGAAVAQEAERSRTIRKVGGLTHDFPRPHVEVSLGKKLNPTLPTDASIGVCMCVNVEEALCSHID